MKIRVQKTMYGLSPVDEEAKRYFASLSPYDQAELDVFDPEETPKTKSQRAAIHVLFQQIADGLNDSGLDMKRVLKQEVDIPWEKKTVKEYLWKPILEAMTLKTSTEKMSTVEPDKVYNVLARLLAEKHGFTCPPFPTRYNMGE